MRKFFAFIGKLIAGLAALLFIITAIAALLMTGIDRRLLNSEVYKQALSEQRVYERMPRIVAEQIVMSMNFNPCAENPLLCEAATPEFKDCVQRTLGDDRFQVLVTGEEYPSQAELQLIQPCLQQFGASLTAPTVNLGPGENPLLGAPPEVQDCVKQAIGEEAFTAIYTEQRQASDPEHDQIAACFTQAGYTVANEAGPSYLKNLTVTDWENIIVTVMPPDELQTMTENVIDQTFAFFNGRRDTVSIAMNRLKNRIGGREGLNALVQIIRAQPPCNEQELQEINAMIDGRGGQSAFCRPPEEVLSEMMPILQQQLRDVVQQIPDETGILNSESLQFQGPDGTPGSGFRFIRLVMRLSADIPLAFLLLITLLVVRTPRTWLRWWGIPSFLAGLTTVAFATMMSAALEEAWVGLLAGSLPPYLSIGVVELGRDIVGSIIHGLLESVVLGGLVLGVVGLAGWIGSYFVKHEEDAVPVPAPASE